MNDVQEKLEAIEEVLQQLVVVVNGLSKQEHKQPEIIIPDYNQRLNDINRSLNDLKQFDNRSELKQLLQKFSSSDVQKPPVKEYRFLLFPETNQGQYYKIIFGKLFPWGLLLVLVTYCFSLAQKALEVWKIKEYNQQAEQYVKAWIYMDEHTDSKSAKKRMTEAWQKANE